MSDILDSAGWYVAFVESQRKGYQFMQIYNSYRYQLNESEITFMKPQTNEGIMGDLRLLVVKNKLKINFITLAGSTGSHYPSYYQGLLDMGTGCNDWMVEQISEIVEMAPREILNIGRDIAAFITSIKIGKSMEYKQLIEHTSRSIARLKKAFYYINTIEDRNPSTDEYIIREDSLDDLSKLKISNKSDWYRKEADKALAFARNRVGIKYLNGSGVKPDCEKAVEYFNKAAEQGLAEAQFNLGICYENGEEVRLDYTEAVKWFGKAAGQGLAEAQDRLGACYENGIGVEKDNRKAVEWYSKAADQGYANAQNNLGCCYYNGRGVLLDYKIAAEWYKRAAEQGLAEAQYNLGHQYENGEGLTLDCGKAREWYRKAADQGLEEAQQKLQHQYENGEKERQNYIDTGAWLGEATDQEHGEAPDKFSTSSVDADLKAAESDEGKTEYEKWCDSFEGLKASWQAINYVAERKGLISTLLGRNTEEGGVYFVNIYKKKLFMRWIDLGMEDNVSYAMVRYVWYLNQRESTHELFESVIVMILYDGPEKVKGTIGLINSKYPDLYELNPKGFEYFNQSVYDIYKELRQEYATGNINDDIEKYIKIENEHLKHIEKCPKCGSYDVAVVKNGFQISRSIGGAILLGPLGVLAGLVGSDKYVCRCADCNARWDPPMPDYFDWPEYLVT